MKNADDRTFTIDKSLKIRVEFDGRRAFWVWYKDSRGITRNLADLLGPRRYGNVKAAVDFLMKDNLVSSATTECGVTVSRG